MRLDSNNISVFLMYYHLVLVVASRKKVFDSQMSDFVQAMFVRLGRKYNISLVEWHFAPDHLQILFKAHPNSQLSKFINAFKSASSRLIKSNFPEVKEKLPKGTFWSKGFCLLTTGEVSSDLMQNYIKEQG